MTGLDVTAATAREAAHRTLAEKFVAVGIVEARREARLVLLAALGIDAGELLARPQHPLGDGAERLAAFAARRLCHEPLSRILGRRAFYGLDIGINAQVLDPRPDTETLVEAVLDHAARRGFRERPTRIADLGTGSGAILAALLTHLPKGQGLATDTDVGALVVARQNLDRLGLAARSETRLSDWFAGIDGHCDIIVSNPPYIAAGVLPALEPGVRLYDPAGALDGGDDGLDAYRALACGLPVHLAPGGFAAFEFGAGQGACVAGLFGAAGLRTIEIRCDLAGIERVIVVDRAD